MIEMDAITASNQHVTVANTSATTNSTYSESSETNTLKNKRKNFSPRCSAMSDKIWNDSHEKSPERLSSIQKSADSFIRSLLRSSMVPSPSISLDHDQHVGMNNSQKPNALTEGNSPRQSHTFPMDSENSQMNLGQHSLEPGMTSPIAAALTTATTKSNNSIAVSASRAKPFPTTCATQETIPLSRSIDISPSSSGDVTHPHDSRPSPFSNDARFLYRNVGSNLRPPFGGSPNLMDQGRLQIQDPIRGPPLYVADKLFADSAFNTVQELINVYGLPFSHEDIVDALKKQTDGGCPQPPTPPRTPVLANLGTTNNAAISPCRTATTDGGSTSDSTNDISSAVTSIIGRLGTNQNYKDTPEKAVPGETRSPPSLNGGGSSTGQRDCLDYSIATVAPKSKNSEEGNSADKDENSNTDFDTRNKNMDEGDGGDLPTSVEIKREIQSGRNSIAGDDGDEEDDDHNQDDDGSSDEEGESFPQKYTKPVIATSSISPQITLAPVSRLMALPSNNTQHKRNSSCSNSSSYNVTNSSIGKSEYTNEHNPYQQQIKTELHDSGSEDCNQTLFSNSRDKNSASDGGNHSDDKKDQQEQDKIKHEQLSRYLSQPCSSLDALMGGAYAMDHFNDPEDSSQACDLSRFNDDSNLSTDDRQSDDQGSDDVATSSVASADLYTPRTSVRNVENLLDKCSLEFFSPILQLAQMQNEDKALHAENVKNLTKFSSYLECKNEQCQLENLREHYHCYDIPCVGKILSKKEEIIRHLKWHKKRSESLSHGFLRFSSSDDCSPTFGKNCTHNRKQTHYHCVQPNCDKVYISTSDVQMHSNYHRKDSAIFQEGFQRYRATEECNADYCIFSGQRTTHFHCRRDNCRYTFKNKADMEKHKSFHIRGMQLAREGFRKYLKTEECPFNKCRFSKICNHIHCVRDNCYYVLHSSSQLLSHKRKHERMDSEEAYRRFKMVQKATAAGLLGQDLSLGRTLDLSSSKPSTPSSSSTAISPDLQAPSATVTNAHSSPSLQNALMPVDTTSQPAEPYSGKFDNEVLTKLLNNPMDLRTLYNGAPPFPLEIVQEFQKKQEEILRKATLCGQDYDLKAPQQLQQAVSMPKSLPHDLSQFQQMVDNYPNEGPMKPLKVSNTIQNVERNTNFEEVEQMIRQYFTDNCTRQMSSDDSQQQTEPLNLKSSEAKPNQGESIWINVNRGDRENPIECFMATNDIHVHCLVKGCEAVVPHTLKDITEHMRMHELNRNAESLMQSSNLLQITSIEGFFNRKRGRPPKNRVVEVYNNNAQQSPQAIFTSFKLEKNFNEHSASTAQQSTSQRSLATSVQSNNQSGNFMMESTGQGSTATADSILNYLAEKKFRIYQENEKCSELHCAYNPSMHFHCIYDSRCHFATRIGRSMDKHMQDFHLSRSKLFEHFEYFDRGIDCNVNNCRSNRTQNHFHCVRCRQDLLLQADLSQHSCIFSNQTESMNRNLKDMFALDDPSSWKHSFRAREQNSMAKGHENDNNNESENEHDHRSSNNDENTNYGRNSRSSCSNSENNDTALNLETSFGSKGVHNSKNNDHEQGSKNCSSGDAGSESPVIGQDLSDNSTNELGRLHQQQTTQFRSFSSHDQAPTITCNADRKLELSEEEKISVVRAAGTYFPQNSGNGEEVSPTPPTTAGPTRQTLPAAEPTNLCQRPFCKLKRKQHKHCDLCNQAFSEEAKLKVHRLKHSSTALGSLLDAESDMQNRRMNQEAGPAQNMLDQQPRDFSKMMRHSPTTTPTPSTSTSTNVALPPSTLQQMLPQNFIDSLSMQNIHLAHLALYQQNPFYYQNLYPFLGNPGYPVPSELLQSQFENSAMKGMMKSEGMPGYPFVGVGPSAAAAAAAVAASTAAQLEMQNTTSDLCNNFKQKRKADEFPGAMEVSSKKVMRTNKQGNFKIFKDEPIPHGYLKFRFNEDCKFPNCGYRNHQSHFHCCRNDCYYSFCDKTRFVQHTARHERLDKLMGDDFKQYRANMRCGYEECAYNKNLAVQNNKSSHFHCLKCSFICSDTNKVVAHRRQHCKMEYIRMAGFRKVGNNEKCTTTEFETSNGECTYSQKQTHYHCLVCDCSVLSRAQLGSHRHRI